MKSKMRFSMFPVSLALARCPAPQAPVGTSTAKRDSVCDGILMDGEHCIPLCPGYDPSPPLLSCFGDQLVPEAFACKPQRTSKVREDTAFVDDFPVSNCLQEAAECSHQRLQYVTHLAQSGTWEGTTCTVTICLDTV
ncbi:unnamed protein product [Durusdinium trenchii]|uniref:Uncharacterized protein n=1 Tax=Durusdinium trenchii TaxID=1381693 RepID=A0ABP0JLU5_9DINO